MHARLGRRSASAVLQPHQQLIPPPDQLSRRIRRMCVAGQCYLGVR
ncbi:MAG TPA: hypothetical protein VKE41_15405 [Roseiflexaceae bacterium]|nr:hypothetical protein [Roseiflexaceae bacterium]